MKKHFCIVTIESGKITTQTPFVKMLWELKDGKYIIEIAVHNKRSNPQNRYYWGASYSAGAGRNKTFRNRGHKGRVP